MKMQPFDSNVDSDDEFEYYNRLFGTKCAKCSAGFSKNDFVMRARNKIYHIDCFRCVACSRQLIPGDEFALRDDGLFCKADHEVVERATSTPTGTKSENSDSGVGSPSNNNNNESKPNLHTAGKPFCMLFSIMNVFGK